MKTTLILLSAMASFIPANVLAISGETWVGPPPANGSLGGDWNTATNWSPAVVPNSVGAAVTINTTSGTTDRQFTLSSNVTIGSLSIVNPANSTNEFGMGGNPNPTLTWDAAGDGPATLTVTGSSPGTNINNVSHLPMILNDDIVITLDPTPSNDVGYTMVWKEALSGHGGITKNGIGTLILADNDKAFTGPIVINAGAIKLEDAVTLSGTSALTVNNGGQLVLAGFLPTALGPNNSVPLTLNGFGPPPTVLIDAGQYVPGAIRTFSGVTDVIPNRIVLQSDTGINQIGTPGTLTLTNTISGTGRLFAGVLAEDPLTHGTIILTADNSYSGGTTVQLGTLDVRGALADLGTGNVTVDGVSSFSANRGISRATGRLTIESGVTNAIADFATLTLTGDEGVDSTVGGYATLGAGVNERVGGLVLGGLTQPPGTYGSTSSAATYKSNTYFAGPGMVTVVPIPEPATLLLAWLGLGSFAWRSRKPK